MGKYNIKIIVCIPKNNKFFLGGYVEEFALQSSSPYKSGFDPAVAIRWRATTNQDFVVENIEKDIKIKNPSKLVPDSSVQEMELLRAIFDKVKLQRLLFIAGAPIGDP